MNKLVQPVLIGLLLGVFTILLAEFGGMVMGKDEDAVKDMLKSKASVVLDQERANEQVADAWKEMKRAHSHAEGLGVIIVALSLVVALTKLVPMGKTLLSIGIGLGGLFYPMTIYLAALRMPAMGEEAARESLELMAVGSIGLFMLCTGLTFLYLLYALATKNNTTILSEKE